MDRMRACQYLTVLLRRNQQAHIQQVLVLIVLLLPPMLLLLLCHGNPAGRLVMTGPHVISVNLEVTMST